MQMKAVNDLFISICRDFSPCPGPRYITEGDNSGQLFRIKHLEPLMKEAINNNKKLHVDLDGTAGYGTSFLEEAFGGLIREAHINYETIIKHLQLKSDEENYLVDDIMAYLKDAYNER